MIFKKSSTRSNFFSQIRREQAQAYAGVHILQNYQFMLLLTHANT